MTLRIRFPEREDALKGNVEIVNDQDERIAIGHLEVDSLVGLVDGDANVGPMSASVRFVGHVDQPSADPLAAI